MNLTQEGKINFIYILIVAVFAVIVGGGVLWYSGQGILPDRFLGNGGSDSEITNFDECIAAGNPAMESYPRQCRTADGKTFVEDIGNELEKMDLIRIDTPRPNQTIESPLAIEGQARGYWFFEADFPVVLLDENDNVIANAVAHAKDEWMTEDFVPFQAELEFTSPSVSRKGTLVLKKDNPSGLPEHADELRVPVYFNQKELAPILSREEAFDIARENRDCAMTGILTDKYVYNEVTRTWWIDLERVPELEKDGCNPACVVYEETKTAEVNWRCTGLKE